jgi:hypothetical protein
MSVRRLRGSSGLVVPDDEPLIGVILERDGREIACFFSSEEDADRAIPGGALADALALAGAWSDLDWDGMERQLDRIRHESPPSAPLTL